ncbi:hypothetical protein I551_6863 [Mycobacterium ulcerans str. Harvey]|uniref:DUF4350 domain-containing protein n=1 Tax=Mycobacterium ulcerans str. Harvey TaxID=1299332 RepID=A0ABP3AA23_MYCUL|nr:hypothetical protein I551_6863 [Mycobacterium ulcerans str. Harvey]
MDPESTSGSGARALVTLLREGGVEVVVANTVAGVENAARADTLLLVAQTQYLANNALLNRLSRVPGDLLLVEPTARTRRVLTPKLRVGAAETLAIRPDCPLREADRAGTVRFGPSDAYRGKGELAMISCYGGALVRYQDIGRTVTVVGSNHFMTNDGLLEQGNAALAMNLAGARPRLIWYAPHLVEGETSSPSSLSDLIPANVSWIVWQLWLAVILVALWKGRRMGPLVAEEMPVVVRASETVEGAAGCTGPVGPAIAPRMRCAPRHCSGYYPDSASAPARTRKRSRSPLPSAAAPTRDTSGITCLAPHRRTTTIYCSLPAHSTTSKGRSLTRDTSGSHPVPDHGSGPRSIAGITCRDRQGRGRPGGGD